MKDEEALELAKYDLDRIRAREELKEAHRKQLKDFDRDRNKKRTALLEKFKKSVVTTPDLKA